MKRSIISACALIAFSIAGAASAETRITATLASSQANHGRVIAARAVWACQGGACVAQAAPDEALGPSGCRELARQVGPVTAYDRDGKALDAKSLAKCNAGLATPQAGVTTASR